MTPSRSSLTLAGISVIGAAAFLWPLWASPAPSTAAHSTDAPYLMVLILPLLLAATFSSMSEGELDAKAVAVLGVLAAAGAVMRMPTGGLAGTEMVFFLMLPGGRVMGRTFGFLLGCCTLFASALLTGGVGPWLPFQMLGAAWIGYGAGILPRARGRLEIAVLIAYGAAASMVYGMVMNLWFWPFAVGSDTSISFVPGDPLWDNLGRFWAFHVATSLGWDVLRAATVAVLCVVLGAPILAALRRARRRAAFDDPVTFATTTDVVSSGTG